MLNLPTSILFTIMLSLVSNGDNLNKRNYNVIKVKNL